MGMDSSQRDCAGRNRPQSEWKEVESDSEQRETRRGGGGGASRGEAHVQGFAGCVKNTDIGG